MPTWNTIALFLSTTLILVVTPGPVVMYLIASSVEQGRRAGLLCAIGVGFGTLLHFLAAAIGLSAILKASTLAFTIVQYAGAAYLLYLGVCSLLVRPKATQIAVSLPRSPQKLFVQGALINVLNPKTALFIIAWLPRFIDFHRGSVAGQIVFFGCLLILLGFCNDSFYVFLAGTARQWLKQNQRWLAIQHYLVGCVYLGLGLVAAMFRGR